MTATTRTRTAAALLAALAAIVVLFPGSAPPAEARRRLTEKSLNLDITRRVSRHLREAGVRVVLTRNGDRYIRPEGRPRIANRRGTDIFVSIHNNSGSRRAERTEIYRQVSRRGSRALANHMATAFRDGFPGRRVVTLARRGRHGDYYAVLREARVPAVIVEGAFLSNPKDARRLADPDFRERLADAITHGILSYQQSLAAATAPEIDPGVRLEGAAFPSPTSGRRRVYSARRVGLWWSGHPVVTLYRVYRNDRLIAEIPWKAPGPGGKRQRISFVDEWAAPGQAYEYQIRAVQPVEDPAAGTRTFVESEPLRLSARTPPISVTLDPGHGGKDAGAVGTAP